MNLQRFVGYGEKLPTGYGIAYCVANFHGAICYPVPLNLLVRHGRSLWLWMKLPPKNWVEHLEQGAYDRGYQEGRKVTVVNQDAVIRQAINDAYERGKCDMLAEIRQIIQECKRDG